MVIIVTGMLAFALIHSLTAGARFKNWFKQQYGERAYHGLYRVCYNLLSVLILAPIMLTIWLNGNVLYTIPADWWPVFDGLQLTGSIGLVIALLQIDLFRFAGLTQLVALWRGDPLPLPPEKLQTRGLYAVVRHPLYLFSLLALWFIYPMTDLMLVFNMAATLYFFIGSFYEEQRMVQAFGSEYEHYRQRVAWLIPFLRLPRARKS